MKYIFVLIGPISNYPPALSTILTLNDLGKKVYFIGNQIDETTKKILNDKKIAYHEILKDFSIDISTFKKISRVKKVRNELWNVINEIYDEKSILWVTSDLSVKYLGKDLLNYKYILHMFELQKYIYYFTKYPIFKMQLKKIAQNALGVIQAEYNRAHISKTWWELKELPYILPNKPYKMGIKKNSIITDGKAREVIERLHDKKIILYQGNVSKERPLEEIIKAVDRLGSDYAFVLMSNKNIYKDINSPNYYYIPFIEPPYHLEVTSNAYIGILTYTSLTGVSAYSKLNSIYCAPNKLYEYSHFSVPMIGNDIPGLKYPLEVNGMGEVFSEFTESNIIAAIKKVEENYIQYSNNARSFFKQTDLHNIISKITVNCEKKLLNTGN